MRSTKIWWISGFAFLLAAFVGLPIALVLTQPPQIDSENCRLDGLLPAHTIVLIDQSDPFTSADIEYATSLIYEEARALKKTGRLTVLAINEADPNEGLEVFSRCSPGSPMQANPFFENRRFIAQDWKMRFEEDMKNKVGEIMQKKQAEVSPLLEHMRGILRRVDFRPSVGNRKIVLISDLYQNSDAYSMYTLGLNEKAFQNASYSLEIPNFDNAEIALFRADRKTAIRGDALVEFWSNALSANGAGRVTVVRD